MRALSECTSPDIVKLEKPDTESKYRTECYQLALNLQECRCQWRLALGYGVRIRVRVIELTSGRMKRQTGAYGKARRNIYPKQPATR